MVSTGPSTGELAELLSFADALAERARAGVAVNLLLDAVGSHKAGDGLFLVSYLSTEGYTLTVLLNVRTLELVGFASNTCFFNAWKPSSAEPKPARASPKTVSPRRTESSVRVTLW